jgi:mono/diheme cytochrome c family protein
MKMLVTIVATLLAVVVAALGYVYSGAFDVAADRPHGAIAGWLMQATRDRSIAARSKDVNVPNLDAPESIAEGADEYAEMCAGCHLGPGVADNEFRKGLNPAAPELAKSEGGSPARQFWIVKHGIKMTAMPAWGLTHDDSTIWSIVAFLQKLPTLTPEQYAQMTEESESAHEEHEHMHETHE